MSPAGGLLVDPVRRAKALLLSLWFFLTIANLWLLKPVRTASLLAHVGAADTPWVRLASMVVVGVVVFGYSRLVDRASRLGIAVGANLICAAVLLAFWVAIRTFGEALGGARPFVWAVYVLVDVYAVVLVGIFWTYTNDVMTREEADASYGPIGVGGILGGIAGGAFADAFAKPLGTENLLVPCVLLSIASGAAAAVWERRFRPAPRRREAPHDPAHEEGGIASALAGVRSIVASKYLRLVVAIVVAYEFTATLTDFATNVVFERSYQDQELLAKMYGRLGWIASAVAIGSQLVLVPLVLPRKRLALLLPPLAMSFGSAALFAFPVLVSAFVMAAADRGLNYSLQQSVKETLYVPLDDVQKYKAKAAIDMLVDRAAKALAALVLIVVIARVGLSVRVTVAIALAATVGWAFAAAKLGLLYAERVAGGGADEPKPDRTAATTSAATPTTSGALRPEP